MKNPTVRILLADDSVTVRRLLTETLSNEPGLEVCHAARDGREAVTQFSLVQPDVVILDVEMPVMDGIEAVIAIRQINPKVPILMFSSLTTKGGEATLDALNSGATDYVHKPARSGHLQDAIHHIRTNLTPKVKYWGKWYQEQRSRGARPQGGLMLSRQPTETRNREPMSASPRSAGRKNAPLEIVAIGVSTGGPNALTEILKAIPPQFPVPIVIVQHMPPLFTGLLANRLNEVCPLTVREAADGVAIGPGHVWVAPGDQHLVVEQQRLQFRLRLDQGPPVNSCRPSVDVLFRTVADVYRDRALAVVLTGMGQDGLEGCRHIRQQGGKVIVQDQATSVVWGMPRAVAEAGLAERVLPLQGMADEITRLAQLGRRLTPLTARPSARQTMFSRSHQ
jgi:two-component system chemotaxis response regulator CheB